MAKVSFFAEIEEDVKTSVENFCNKYGRTFTDVIETGLKMYLDSQGTGPVATTVVDDFLKAVRDVQAAASKLPIATKPYSIPTTVPAATVGVVPYNESSRVTEPYTAQPYTTPAVLAPVTEPHTALPSPPPAPYTVAPGAVAKPVETYTPVVSTPVSETVKTYPAGEPVPAPVTTLPPYTTGS